MICLSGKLNATALQIDFTRQLDANRTFDGKSYTFKEMLKGQLVFEGIVCIDTKDRNAHLDMPMNMLHGMGS